MNDPALDEDAVIAVADLVGRTGAGEFKIGYLDDAQENTWYAYAAWRGGTRISADGHPGPVEAADALARRLLSGARCKCGKLVALSDRGAWAPTSATMADGTTWSAEEAEAAGQCRWRRQGARWAAGCDPKPGSRKDRRRRRRR